MENWLLFTFNLSNYAIATLVAYRQSKDVSAINDKKTKIQAAAAWSQEVFYFCWNLGVETYGAYGPQGIKFVKQIEKKKRKKNQDDTCEKLSTFSQFQSTSMAIQKGNAVCVVCYPKDTSTFHRLRGPIQFSSTLSWRAMLKNIEIQYLSY